MMWLQDAGIFLGIGHNFYKVGYSLLCHSVIVTEFLILSGRLFFNSLFLRGRIKNNQREVSFFKRCDVMKKVILLIGVVVGFNSVFAASDYGLGSTIQSAPRAIASSFSYLVKEIGGCHKNELDFWRQCVINNQSISSNLSQECVAAESLLHKKCPSY